MENKAVTKWQALISEYQAAGCSQAEFCRRTGLREKQFSYWKNKLAKSAKQKKDQAFVRLNVEMPQPKREISIVLSNGMKISVPESLESEFVKMMLSMIEGVHV